MLALQEKTKGELNSWVENRLTNVFSHGGLQIYIKVLKMAAVLLRLRWFEVRHKNRYTLNGLSLKHDKISIAQTY
jgi:hypothetical protein